jgi:threonine dehydratase
LVVAVDEILAAHLRLKDLVVKTPLEYSSAFSQMTDTQVFLKCENLQHTRSFKVRGALNKLLTLSNEARAQGVVAASTGNHGAAVAYGCHQFNIQGKIFVPESAAAPKLENIRRYQVGLEFYGTDCMQTELYALDYALHHKMTYISPYNDITVIHGQGTIGVELAEQQSYIDVVLVPIGGGGLIAGIAAYLKKVSPHTKIIGCLPQNSPVMAESIKAGEIIDMDTLPTLSDATAGGIEPGAITFPLCQQLVDDYILVTESQIKHALITLMQTHNLLAEGAAGVALAALLNYGSQFKNKNVVVLLSGGNIRLETLMAAQV